MPDNPYPGPREVSVTYSLREIVDQINVKLDLLPQLAGKIDSLTSDLGDTKTRVTVVETKVDTLEKIQDQSAGVAVFKDKLWARWVGLAGIMGVVAGTTFKLLEML